MIQALLLLASLASAEPPFFLRDTKTPLDTGAINSNVRDLADNSRRIRNDFDSLEDTAQDWTQAHTFAGALTVNGAIVLNSSATINGGVFGTVFRSTFTHLDAAQTTASTSWASIAGSTLTLSMNGGRARLGFSCPFENATIGNCDIIGVLVNGVFIDGETSTVGLSEHCSGAADRREMGGFTHLTQDTYSGSTNFSLIWRVDGSTGRMNNGATSACQFWVEETR